MRKKGEKKREMTMMMTAKGALAMATAKGFAPVAAMKARGEGRGTKSSSSNSTLRHLRLAVSTEDEDETHVLSGKKERRRSRSRRRRTLLANTLGISAAAMFLGERAAWSEEGTETAEGRGEGYHTMPDGMVMKNEDMKNEDMTLDMTASEESKAPGGAAGAGDAPAAIPSPAEDLPPPNEILGKPKSTDPDADSTILLASAEVEGLNDADKRVLKQNKQIQSQNRAPKDFPIFVRKGFDMLIFTDGYKQLESGLLYTEFEAGDGRLGNDGDEVTFHYTGYNEEGGFIDSSYKQKRPAQIRLGIGGMIPGFELALKDMRPGSRRRVIIPPALGPPVGPATFFSAKQYEVFDIQLLGIKSCTTKSFGMISTVKCEE